MVKKDNFEVKCSSCGYLFDTDKKNQSMCNDCKKEHKSQGRKPHSKPDHRKTVAFCKGCGKKHEEGDTYCGGCGNHLTKAEKKKSSGGGVVVFIVLVIIIGVIWGAIGGSEAQDPGVTCDMGAFDDKLCWSWHKNTLGQVQEGMKDMGNSVNDFFGG